MFSKRLPVDMFVEIGPKFQSSHLLSFPTLSSDGISWRFQSQNIRHAAQLELLLALSRKQFRTNSGETFIFNDILDERILSLDPLPSTRLLKQVQRETGCSTNITNLIWLAPLVRLAWPSDNGTESTLPNRIYILLFPLI